MEDSLVLGLLKEQKRVKQETKKEDGNGKKVVPNEALIKKAIRKRSSYLKDNAEKVTMGGLRMLLEEDLKLDKFTLGPFKKFIRQQLDEVLSFSEVVEPVKSAKKIVKKKPDRKLKNAVDQFPIHLLPTLQPHSTSTAQSTTTITQTYNTNVHLQRKIVKEISVNRKIILRHTSNSIFQLIITNGECTGPAT